MANKVIIGILLFLVVLSGGFGYYGYMLNLQLNYLSEQLAAFQTEQAAQIGEISGELTALRGETMTMVGDLAEEIDDNLTRIATLEDETDENLTRISNLEGRTGETLAKIDVLEDEISGTAEFSQSLARSVMDVNKVYQEVSQATVRISDGDRTVGSGFILDREGHVVTAQHVVNGLDEIYVVLPDGRISTATDTSGCLFSDVAILTLEDELVVEPPALTDSATVKIGEPVAAIGNPFRLTETITTGIVSQINRFVEIEYESQTRWVANLIQFDAAVNYGNSGCPLVNSKGEVIGMVIARIGPEEGEGIYYAVSSNKLKRVTDSLIAQGSFDYPWLGISITDLTPQMALTWSLATANGALVEGVLADSPAKEAGLEVDDIIAAIDGVTVRNVADLVSYLGEHKSPGDEAAITLIRDTDQLELSLEVGKRP